MTTAVTLMISTAMTAGRRSGCDDVDDDVDDDDDDDDDNDDDGDLTIICFEMKALRHP
jgi:hypothetical protein